MRKLLPMLLLALLLVGCGSASDGNDPQQTDLAGNIRITETEQYRIHENQIQFHIDLNDSALEVIKPINTNQAAIDVGTSIIEGLHRDGRLSEYTLLSATHSTEDNVWYFEYALDQRNTDIDHLIDGSCLYVAVDGNKGKFIQAWLEE